MKTDPPIQHHSTASNKPLVSPVLFRRRPVLTLRERRLVVVAVEPELIEVSLAGAARGDDAPVDNHVETVVPVAAGGVDAASITWALADHTHGLSSLHGHNQGLGRVGHLGSAVLRCCRVAVRARVKQHLAVVQVMVLRFGRDDNRITAPVHAAGNAALT